MKFALKSLLFITFINILLSIQLSHSEQDLIGDWKVKTVIKTSGKRERGEKILSFYADKTFVSKNIESDRAKTGIWRYDPSSEVIYLKIGEKELWEAIDLVKLTKKQMVVKEEGKTIKCVRVETTTNQ